MIATMANVDQMLAFAAVHTGELAVPDIDARPRGRVAVLTCMDTRIDPSSMLGIERGDAHIIRNAGGLVTDDAIRSLAISQHLLGTEEIVVVMHEHCGLCGASEEDFLDLLRAAHARPQWRMGAFEDLEAALREGLARLRSASELPHRQQVRGLIFDPRTGTLRKPGEE